VITTVYAQIIIIVQGRIRGGGAHPVHAPPPKKNWKKYDFLEFDLSISLIVVPNEKIIMI
jgi:hypothetical protein